MTESEGADASSVSFVSIAPLTLRAVGLARRNQTTIVRRKGPKSYQRRDRRLATIERSTTARERATNDIRSDTNLHAPIHPHLKAFASFNGTQSMLFWCAVSLPLSCGEHCHEIAGPAEQVLRSRSVLARNGRIHGAARQVGDV
jgi:hypothetical protein